jgi:hypothetical protein
MSIRSSGPVQSGRPGLVQQHPLACFLVLTYLAAWFLWAPLVIFRDALPPVVGFTLVLLGSCVPSTVAIVLVAIIHGKAGWEGFSVAWLSGAWDFAGTWWC